MSHNTDLSSDGERIIPAVGTAGIGYAAEYQSFERLTQLTAAIFNVPIVCLILLDKDRQWVKYSNSILKRDIPIENSLCQYTLRSSSLFEVPDASQDSRFFGLVLVNEDPFIRYYAGVPLIDANGAVLGTLSLFDTRARRLNAEQQEILMGLASQVMVTVNLVKKQELLDHNTWRFEELLEITKVSPEIHCIMDFDGKIRYINEAVNSLLDYSIAEAMTLNLMRICYREDLPLMRDVIGKLFKAGEKNLRVDFRLVSKRGAIKWISWSMIAKNNRLYIYGRDITLSKRVEGELTKLSFVASKVNNGVVINDAHNRVTWVNDAFEKITGFSLEDVKGQRLGDLINGPKTDMEILKKVRQHSKDRQSFTIDMLAYRKDGQEIWLSVYSTVVMNDQGEVDTEVEIIIDITEKKRAEKELQVLSLVASKTDTGVSLQDKEGNITWVNQSLERLTGYMLDELRGKMLGDVISPNSYDQQLINEARERSRNNQSYTIEVMAEKKDGSLIWLSVSNTPIINNKGVVERQIELISDITQRKQVERETIEAKEQALKLSQAKEMFLSVMSHEIRTPLNAVIGMTHLLLDNDPKSSQIDDLNLLKFSGENLLHIINDILDFTKMETGKMELEVFPFNLKTLANDIINSLQVNVRKRENELILKYDPAIPDMLTGDKSRLYQVLMNFLGNAIKFTDHGVVQLRMSLLENQERKVKVRFEVEDNGIGIPKDKQSYIFEVFTQAKTDISRKYGGTGLGLAITKKLLKLFNSDIHVDSEEGKGTIFSFEITFNKAEDHPHLPGLTNEISVFIGRRILVVDDNDINILIAKRILSKWGLEVESAINGYEAIEKIMKENFDLVFMDIKMPGIDGFETTSIIRDIRGDYYKSLPIIALTASTLQNDHFKFIQCGMNGHILKPFNPEEIKSLLYDVFSAQASSKGN